MIHRSMRYIIGEANIPHLTACEQLNITTLYNNNIEHIPCIFFLQIDYFHTKENIYRVHVHIISLNLSV